MEEIVRVNSFDLDIEKVNHLKAVVIDASPVPHAIKEGELVVLAIIHGGKEFVVWRYNQNAKFYVLLYYCLCPYLM